MNQSLELISELFQSISAASRLEILLLVGAGETCVCHIESKLGYRQAYISQQLMALRQAGLLEARRDGKFVFYRLMKPELLPFIQQAAGIVGVNLPVFEAVSPQKQCALSVETIEPLSQEQ